MHLILHSTFLIYIIILIELFHFILDIKITLSFRDNIMYV